jgi:Ca2+-binding EF-hand superfamily protein
VSYEPSDEEIQDIFSELDKKGNANEIDFRGKIFTLTFPKIFYIL